MIDRVTQLLAASTEVLGHSIHVWVLGLGAVGIFWAFVLVRDL